MRRNLDLDSLNPEQKAAVLHGNGPLLVLAGAGSGKTRVVTYRIAWLICHHHIRPSRILSVTFTNKAAREMKDRIFNLIGPNADGLWIGTFHSMCMKILRRHAHLLGYSKDFEIFDTDNQTSLIREILKTVPHEDEDLTPQVLRSRISRKKCQILTWEDIFSNDIELDETLSLLRRYQNELKSKNAMDFDDLLINTLELFKQHPDVRQLYQVQFEHLIVDEYQDTNLPQHEITRILAHPQQNLCVVGDEDQSIYGWRGAKYQNILNLKREFKGLRTIKLEQNYRSTPQILQAANQIIRRNNNRIGKTLHANRVAGNKIQVVCCSDEIDEARHVTNTILRIQSETSIPYNDIAILYRVNSLSRVLEREMNIAGIPYRIIGGLAFYERQEVKDLLAYLRLLLNPHDDLAFQRVVNVPKRAIGQTTLRRLLDVAISGGCSLFTTAQGANQIHDVKWPVASRLIGFTEEILHLSNRLESQPLSETLKQIIQQVRYEEHILSQEKHKEKAETRIANILELVTALAEAEERINQTLVQPWEEEKQEIKKADILRAFLEEVSLDTDRANQIETPNTVSLMTIHSAKGLEFSLVFLVGLEQGLLPHERSFEDREQMEEETRLCYVAFTRAKDQLFLSYTMNRNIFGESQQQVPSDFLEDLPEDLVIHETTPSAKEDQIIFQESRRQVYSRPFHRQTTPTPSPHKTPQQGDHLVAGNWVKHRTFGVGRIISVSGYSPRRHIRVEFPMFGKRDLIESHAHLEPYHK